MSLSHKYNKCNLESPHHEYSSHKNSLFVHTHHLKDQHLAYLNFLSKILIDLSALIQQGIHDHQLFRTLVADKQRHSEFPLYIIILKPDRFHEFGHLI